MTESSLDLAELLDAIKTDPNRSLEERETSITWAGDENSARVYSSQPAITRWSTVAKIFCRWSTIHFWLAKQDSVPLNCIKRYIENGIVCSERNTRHDLRNAYYAKKRSPLWTGMRR